jgi:hypothetical protein
MCQRVLILILICGCAQDSIDHRGFEQNDLSVSEGMDVGVVNLDALVGRDKGADFELGDGSSNVVEDTGLSPISDAAVGPMSDASIPHDQGGILHDATMMQTDAELVANDAMVLPDMMVPEPPTGFTLCGLGMTERVGRGTWAEPIQIGRFPFVDRFTTATEGESRVDTYDCAPNTGEFGREVVYAFELAAPGDLLAEVRDDGADTDIDLHLLRDHTDNGREVVGCLSRAHTRLVQERLEPGRYLLVADSWSNVSGALYEGAYDIAIDVFEHRVWRDVPLSDDVLWSRYRGTVDGSWQSINVLRLEPSAVERMTVGAHDGCSTVTREVVAREAVAGVNAGYFSGGCADTGFLRVDDSTVSTSLATTSDPPLQTEARVGWRGSHVSFEWGESGSDWTEPRFALGAHPMLVQDGVAQAQVQNGTQVYSETDWEAQPRTAFGLTNQGDVLLLTLDGRTSAGAGLSTPALADWLVAQYDLSGALNLDGGGSTTFSVNDCWVGTDYGTWGARAFNAPSGNEQSDERGARGVSSGIYVQ